MEIFSEAIFATHSRATIQLFVVEVWCCCFSSFGRVNRTYIGVYILFDYLPK